MGTHGHVALGRSEGLGRQHVRLHQIVHVDPVHPGPAVPESEHEQPLLDVALGVEERGNRHRPQPRAVTCHLCAEGPHILALGGRSLPQPQVPPMVLAGPGADAWSLLSLNPTGREGGLALPSLIPHIQLTCKSRWLHCENPSRIHCFPPSRLPSSLTWTRNSALRALCCAPTGQGTLSSPGRGHVSLSRTSWAPILQVKASVLTIALLIWLQLLCDDKTLACPSPSPGLLPGTCWRVPPQGSDLLLPLPGGPFLQIPV